MNQIITRVRGWHDRFFGLVSFLQSPFLLFVRLYWGWQLAQSGWGMLHPLSNVAEDFRALGLLSRITGLVLTVNMIMAYVIGDHDALLSFFSDPDKFIAAAPFAFLIVSLIVLIFGAGKISVDTLLAFFYGSTRVKQANSVTA